MPKKTRTLPTKSFIETPELLAETCITPDGPMFAVYDRTDGSHVYQKEFDLAPSGASLRVLPLLPDDALAHFVKFPSALAEYHSELLLLDDIRAFIRKWVDLSDEYEKIAALYVMFTWCHDEFFEIPYLRIIADLGSGKTRLGMQVLGSVCYKAFATIAASTLSPLFRTLDQVGGTLVLDEADLGDKSEKTGELVQILNSGYVRGMSVMRSEKTKDGFIAARYKVFGPKIIISREHFKDAALESRCVELRITRTTRNDIPFFIDETLEEDASELRNKLLLWRFRTYGTHRAKIDNGFLYLDIPPRLKQLLLVLSGTVSDPSLLDILKDLGKQLATEHAERRGESLEGEIVALLIDRGTETAVSCQELAEALNESALPSDKKSARSIGWYLRERLGLKPMRQTGSRRYGIKLSASQLQALALTYGLPYTPTDLSLEPPGSPTSDEAAPFDPP